MTFRELIQDMLTTGCMLDDEIRVGVLMRDENNCVQVVAMYRIAHYSSLRKCVCVESKEDAVFVKE